MKKLLSLALCLVCSTTCTYATNKGLDISEWQGDSIDFTQLKSDGMEVVYIRVAEGGDYEDKYWKINYEGATDAELKIGFYHYMDATTTDEASTQAQYLYSLIKDTTYDCYPAMDFESFGSLSDSEINEIAQTYISELSDLVGTTVVIYSDSSNASSLWDESLNVYPLWVADYSSSDPDLGNWTEWAGFQYSDSGSVNGIDDDTVDLDYFKDTIFISQADDTADTTTTDTTADTTTADTTTATTTTTDTTTATTDTTTDTTTATTDTTTDATTATTDTTTDTTTLQPILLQMLLQLQPILLPTLLPILLQILLQMLLLLILTPYNLVTHFGQLLKQMIPLWLN